MKLTWTFELAHQKSGFFEVAILHYRKHPWSIEKYCNFAGPCSKTKRTRVLTLSSVRAMLSLWNIWNQLLDNINRMWNTAIKFFWARPFMILHTTIMDSVIGQYFPNCKSAADLLANLNGAMINTNFVLDYPRLQPTTFINVGGIQISEKPKPLPKVWYRTTGCPINNCIFSKAHCTVG